jgi:hypothetical protein
MYVYPYIDVSSPNHCCREKAISITYSECVFVALVIQHATRIRHIVICRVSGSTIFFHTISQTAQFSEKKFIENKMCILIFPTTFVRNTSHFTRELYIVINVHRSSCKVPVILARFQWSLDFLDRFSKSFKISNLMKILQWESSCCVRTDRHDEANSRFSKFCERA